MGDELRKITRLREQVEALKDKASKADGGLERVLHELREEFKCHSLEDAEALLASKAKKLEQAQAKLSKMISEYEETWGDVLE